MAIVGNLAECQPAQIVRVIAQGRKSGRLTLQGQKATAECYFRAGRLDALRLPDSRPLIETLSSAGVLNAEQCASLKPYGAQSDQGLAKLLAELGYVEPPRLLATLRSQATESVQIILRWDRGSFRLDGGVPAPEESIPLGLDLVELVAVAPAAGGAGRIEAPTGPLSAAAAPAAPAPRPRRWWDWLFGGKDDRRT